MALNECVCSLGMASLRPAKVLVDRPCWAPPIPKAKSKKIKTLSWKRGEGRPERRGSPN